MSGICMMRPARFARSVCYIPGSGLNARPCYKPVKTPCHYVARLRVVAIALAVEGLITRHKRRRNG